MRPAPSVQAVGAREDDTLVPHEAVDAFELGGTGSELRKARPAIFAIVRAMDSSRRFSRRRAHGERKGLVGLRSNRSRKESLATAREVCAQDRLREASAQVEAAGERPHGRSVLVDAPGANARVGGFRAE